MPSPFHDKTGQQLSWSQASQKIRVRFANYFLDFVLFKLWLVGFVPSHTFRRFVYQVFGLKIGKHSTIHMGARFFDPKGIKIGEGSIIGDHAFLDGRDSLIIGNHVDIASEVMIYNGEHEVNDPDFKPVNAPVIIEDYVFIGPRAIILPGVKLGMGSVVAAGAVVTKDVASKTIVGGVPAKPIGQRQVNEFHYRLGRFRLFQ